MLGPLGADFIFIGILYLVFCSFYKIRSVLSVLSISSHSHSPFHLVARRAPGGRAEPHGW